MYLFQPPASHVVYLLPCSRPHPPPAPRVAPQLAASPGAGGPNNTAFVDAPPIPMPWTLPAAALCLLSRFVVCHPQSAHMPLRQRPLSLSLPFTLPLPPFPCSRLALFRQSQPSGAAHLPCRGRIPRRLMIAQQATHRTHACTVHSKTLPSTAFCLPCEWTQARREAWRERRAQHSRGPLVNPQACPARLQHGPKLEARRACAALTSAPCMEGSIALV